MRERDEVLRINEIWRDTREKGLQGTLLAAEFLCRNRARVMYPVEETRLQEASETLVPNIALTHEPDAPASASESGSQ